MATRKLTPQQKRYLDSIIRERPDTFCTDDLTTCEWNKVSDMNETEVLWQAVNRYLSDKYFNTHSLVKVL